MNALFARLGFVLAIGAALTFAALGPRAAHAQDKRACEMTTDEAASIGRRAAEQTPGGVFHDYSGQDAARLLAAINAEPPESHWAADHVLTVELPGARVVIALAEGDCEYISFSSPPALWRPMLAHALGLAL